MNLRSLTLASISRTLVAVALTTSAALADSSITVSDAYARAVPPGQQNSAAFMVLNNSSSDERLIVKAESNISKLVELHTHINDNGMMRMRQVENIAIPPNGKTTLKPGGLHVMFLGLHKDLNVGDTVNVTLSTDDGQQIPLTINARKIQMKMKHKKHH